MCFLCLCWVFPLLFFFRYPIPYRPGCPKNLAQIKNNIDFFDWCCHLHQQPNNALAYQQPNNALAYVVLSKLLIGWLALAAEISTNRKLCLMRCCHVTEFAAMKKNGEWENWKNRFGTIYFILKLLWDHSALQFIEVSCK